MNRSKHPGETLLELLKVKNMTQVELARRMKRPVKTINEIIKGKVMITPNTALQLQKVFKSIKAEFWLVREAHYQLFLLKKRRK